jgi:hypothetical protein
MRERLVHNFSGVGLGANAQDGHNQVGLHRTQRFSACIHALDGNRQEVTRARDVLHVTAIRSTNCSASTASQLRPRFISTLCQTRRQQVSCIFAVSEEGGGGS